MNAPSRFYPPAKAPKPVYARSPAVKRLIKAARSAGLDPAGFEALPDGTLRIIEARNNPAAGQSLFDELEAKGKL